MSREISLSYYQTASTTFRFGNAIGKGCKHIRSLVQIEDRIRKNNNIRNEKECFTHCLFSLLFTRYVLLFTRYS